MKTIGVRLKVARTKLGLSQTDAIARLLDVGTKISQPYLSKIENDIAEPDISQLKAFSKIYNTPILELIFDEKELKEIQKV